MTYQEKICASENKHYNLNQRVFLKKGEYILEIRDVKENKTISQNNYLWGEIYPKIGKHLGYDSETVHEVFKNKFGVKIELRKGTVINKSTSKYTLQEMSDYIDKIIRFSDEFLNVKIESPK